MYREVNYTLSVQKYTSAFHDDFVVACLKRDRVRMNEKFLLYFWYRRVNDESYHIWKSIFCWGNRSMKKKNNIDHWQVTSYFCPIDLQNLRRGRKKKQSLYTKFNSTMKWRPTHSIFFLFDEFYLSTEWYLLTLGLLEIHLTCLYIIARAFEMHLSFFSRGIHIAHINDARLGHFCAICKKKEDEKKSIVKPKRRSLMIRGSL